MWVWNQFGNGLLFQSSLLKHGAGTIHSVVRTALDRESEGVRGNVVGGGTSFASWLWGLGSVSQPVWGGAEPPSQWWICNIFAGGRTLHSLPPSSFLLWDIPGRYSKLEHLEAQAGRFDWNHIELIARSRTKGISGGSTCRWNKEFREVLGRATGFGTIIYRAIHHGVSVIVGWSSLWAAQWARRRRCHDSRRRLKVWRSVWKSRHCLVPSELLVLVRYWSDRW